MLSGASRCERQQLKQRQQYLKLDQPQKVWIDFGKWMGRTEEPNPKKKKFEDLTVKKVLEELTDHQIARNLAVLASDTRLYALAKEVLEQLNIPMRPVVRENLDLPPDAKHPTILELIDKLGWSASDRSYLADALGFARSDAGDKRLADALARVKELEVQITKSETTSTEIGESDATAKEIAELKEQIRLADEHWRSRKQQSLRTAATPRLSSPTAPGVNNRASEHCRPKTASVS